jgi:hypothetical protein
MTLLLSRKISDSMCPPPQGRLAVSGPRCHKTTHALQRADWETVFFADLDVIRNDHCNIGLWYYNIPTVFVFSHTISPMFYALAKRYLACEGDRALLNLCCPNVRILHLLGVSYVTLGRHPNP